MEHSGPWRDLSISISGTQITCDRPCRFSDRAERAWSEAWWHTPKYFDNDEDPRDSRDRDRRIRGGRQRWEHSELVVGHVTQRLVTDWCICTCDVWRILVV